MTLTTGAVLALTLCACGPDPAQLGRACDGGDAAACRELGWMQLSGLGAPKDKKAGRLRYEDACGLGDAASCGMVGELHYAKRDAEARKFFEEACAADQLASCVDLGWMWAHGEGGPRDPAAADRLYGRACDGGLAQGCFVLGLAQRERGADAAARRSFSRACDHGDRLACAAGAAERAR